MKVLTLEFSRLRNEEHFQFHTDFRAAVREIGAETLKIVAPFERFSALWAEEDAILEQIRKSILTQTLVELDKARDDCFKGLTTTIKGSVNNFDAAKKTAAKKLMIVVETYGNVTHNNYRDETASIYNFVKELNTNYVTELTALGLTLWVTELDKANKAFNNKYDERDTESAGKEIDTNMRAVRKDIDAVYKEMTHFLEAGFHFTGEVIFNDFIKSWNEKVEHYRQILAVREGWSEKRKENAGKSE
jgi:hypothetical protein